jgi:hypothetical protein
MEAWLASPPERRCQWQRRAASRLSGHLVGAGPKGRENGPWKTVQDDPAVRKTFRMTPHDRRTPSVSAPLCQVKPGTTMAAAFPPAGQPVFYSMDSVRRHSPGCYRKHEFDNRVNVRREAIRPLVRASCPKCDKGFVMPSPPASQVAGGNRSEEPAKDAARIGDGISEPGPPRTGNWPKGPVRR